MTLQIGADSRIAGVLETTKPLRISATTLSVLLAAN